VLREENTQEKSSALPRQARVKKGIKGFGKEGEKGTNRRTQPKKQLNAVSYKYVTNSTVGHFLSQSPDKRNRKDAGERKEKSKSRRRVF